MQNTPRWHIKDWGIWGWIETAFKLVAVAIGVSMFFATQNATTLTIGGHPHLFSLIILALMTVVTVPQILSRFAMREVISLLFAFAYLVGHLSLLIGMLHAPTVISYPLGFGLLVILGDLVKTRFMATSNYSEAGFEAPTLTKIVYVVLGIYAAFVIGLLVG